MGNRFVPSPAAIYDVSTHYHFVKLLLMEFAGRFISALSCSKFTQNCAIIHYT